MVINRSGELKTKQVPLAHVLGRHASSHPAATTSSQLQRANARTQDLDRHCKNDAAVGLSRIPSDSLITVVAGGLVNPRLAFSFCN